MSFGHQIHVGYAMKRVYTQLDKRSEILGRTKDCIVSCIGAVLTPFYRLSASLLGAPGIRLHVRCGALALRLLINRRISLSEALTLVCHPFDSARYFEFYIFGKCPHSCMRWDNYLDIISPLLYFLLLLVAHPKFNASLLNSDKRDMIVSQGMLHMFNLNVRCRTYNCVITGADLSPVSFDIITSISVIEHIPEPDDLIALKYIWQLLRPGGRLFISVLYAAEAFEENICINEYGILKIGGDGYVYGQRFYNEELLKSQIFQLLDQPARTRIYGERHKGASMANRACWSRDAWYPFGRESFMMGREYRYYEHVRKCQEPESLPWNSLRKRSLE